MNLGINLKKLLSVCLIVLCYSGIAAAFQSSSQNTREERLKDIFQKLNASNSNDDRNNYALQYARLTDNYLIYVREEVIAEKRERLKELVKEDFPAPIKAEIYSALGGSYGRLLHNYTSKAPHKITSEIFFTYLDSSLYWKSKISSLTELTNEQYGWNQFKIASNYFLLERTTDLKFDSTLTYLEKAKYHADQNDVSQLDIYIMLWQTRVISFKNPQKAIKLGFELIEFAEQHDLEKGNVWDTILGAYLRKYNDDTLRTIVDEKLNSLRSSLAGNFQSELAEMDRQFETSFTKDQLTQQEELNQLQKTQINQRNTILGVVALLLFGSVGGGLFFYRLNRKNKQLAENNALLVKEQNHRVKNNLQMISSLLSLQANQVEGDTKESMLDGSRRVQAIALLHRKLYDDLEGVKEVNIKEFTEELVEDLLFASGKQDIPVKLSLDEVTLPVEKSVHLALILNELITNSIKHVFSKPQLNGECLELSISEKASEVLIQYKDHSGSFDEEQFESSESLGNQIIKSQSEYLSKKWSVEDEYGFSYQLAISL